VGGSSDQSMFVVIKATSTGRGEGAGGQSYSPLHGHLLSASSIFVMLLQDATADTDSVKNVGLVM